MAISNPRSAERKQWKKELSAGGVVIKREAGRTYVLMIVSTAQRSDIHEQRYGFPKGWTGDHGEESLTATALREVREEGGVQAKILADLGDSHYFFSWQSEHIAKTVHYYLMEYVSGDIADHDDEVDRVEWVPQAEVAAKLLHKTDREIFARAQKLIRS
jgi:8-oxo-dGTP pyrophosphatase MutT (NUDIX family)